MDRVAVDLDGIRAFEAAGWSARALAYDRFFARISARLAGPLLEAAGADAGTRVLDLASGSGHVAAQAAGRGATVLGIDVSLDMVRLASTLHPALTFHQAYAERLPFADGTFDSVFGNLLLSHLADPERRVAEAVCVVALAGRLALTVWDVPAHSRLMGVIVDAGQKVDAGMSEDLPLGPPAEGCRADRHRGPDNRTRICSPRRERVLGRHADGDGRTAALVDRRPTDVQRRIREAVDRLLAPYATPDGLALPVAIKLAIGRPA